MSHFILKYNPILEIILEANNIAINPDNCKILPDNDTRKVLINNKLKFLSTKQGFILLKKNTTIYKETFEYNELTRELKKTLEQKELDSSISPLNVLLRFLFIANNSFTKNTKWEGLGCHGMNINDNDINYMKHSYKNSNGLIDLSNSSIKYKKKDFLLKQTASLDLQFSNFSLPQDNTTTKIIINIKKPITP